MTAADLVPAEPAPWATFAARRAEGRIPFQHCWSCERAVFYPRVLCPHCGSVELEWRDSAGVGVVYSATYLPARDGGGRHVLLVDLDEGFRVMGSATDDAGAYAIGSRVRGAVDVGNPEAEPRFVFAEEGPR
ncbi:zinc ribbon domain-containing protein [Microbacterium sp. zg-Y818]|uniref:Zn-ribbon domain-containing OB-fold protein n=1 Tax=unclassified Microbacterium TaxID=2609290 RepID=UPI00214C7026|nr:MULTISPECIES: zinc ribbon domain-containing protein [unclassified Microbacterium]MCR2799328.1 zinc ribbon domain-containing protein [Microbacterium sp. zg.Y818]WIM21329.1 zinc ribbon domain-containing protein [Microbacterium sp. zg-Y818]